LKQSDDQYLDINELASYIKRSKGAIRNLILRRAIPYRKPAGRLIFLKKEIDQWVQTSPGKSFEEIKNDLGEEGTVRNTHAKYSTSLNVKDRFQGRNKRGLSYS
jgi:predicted DNA-binding transcriptional regulator AlpA